MQNSDGFNEKVVRMFPVAIVALLGSDGLLTFLAWSVISAILSPWYAPCRSEQFANVPE